MDQLLEQLFESASRAKVLRLFLRNPGSFFTLNDVARSTQVKLARAKSEVRKFERIGLIGKKLILSKKKLAYFVNQHFPLYKSLHDLVSIASQPSRHKLTERIKHLGRVKLAVISGVFLNNDSSRADLLIVGDGIRRSKVEKFLADTEAEIGKALDYAMMETAEFKYRMDMYDRFLRDIFESTHQKLINKLHI